MGKKFAIKGHPSRGKEVIEILEMMGGKNNCDSPADNLGLCYLIDDEFDICAHYFGYDDYEDGELNIFTLEEFLEKYPFKVGDKVVYEDDNDIVVISEIMWDDTVGDIFYNVKRIDDDDCFLCPPELLKPYKEEVINIAKEMITPSSDITVEITDKNNCDIRCPDGYEFYDESGNLIGTKVMIRPKKSKYPKTYGECCQHLGCDDKLSTGKLVLFQQLINAKNAYWKIAGEEMGLGKSWDLTYGCGEWGYWIGYNINENKIYLQDSRILVNHTLVFPTEEMRDTFYENFKDLIEQCKELL